MRLRPKIFISASKDQNLSLEQQDVKKAVLDHIEANEMEPWAYFESGPLVSGWGFNEASIAMSKCSAAIVLAFARWECQGFGSNINGLMPSEGNHFEGGLAIAHGVPLLVIQEAGTLSNGVLDKGPDHAVINMPRGADSSWVSDDNSFKKQTKILLGRALERHVVFVGYCSEATATANAIMLFLTKQNVKFINYQFDFVVGKTIIDQIENAAINCACGIFLFTKDDALSDSQFDMHAPRDNVVFEAGYLSHAKGKGRVFVICEEGAKVPDDLGGVVFASLKDRADVRPIHTQLLQFIKQNL